jgi:hypothetical protein
VREVFPGLRRIFEDAPRPASKLTYTASRGHAYANDPELAEGLVNLGADENSAGDFGEALLLAVYLGLGEAGDFGRVGERDYADAVAIGTAESDDRADFSGAILTSAIGIAAIGADAARVDGQAEDLKGVGIANGAINYSRHRRGR